MLFPSKLKKGDKVCFVAPARKVSSGELLPATQLLERWGLVVIKTPNLFLCDNQFAGEDHLRAKQVQWALDHEDVKAVFCVRGGYGTSRIIDQLNFDLFRSFPKWLVGFSDITVLLNRLYNLGISSVHGPVAILFNQQGNDRAICNLRSLLFTGVVPVFEPKLNILNQVGIVKGPLVGGNLSVLVDQLGTDAFPKLEGAILFLEDLDEYLYHIDRMMVHLRRIGALSKLGGLVIGYMSTMHDNAIPFGKSAYEIIKDAVKELSIPIAFNFPIGHKPLNVPVVVGATYTLLVKKSGVSLVNN